MSKTALAFCLFVCLGLSSAVAQTPDKSPTPKPDYSQEAVVLEQAILKLKFENDGTSVQENYARVRVQSDAGVQHFGLLAFSYESGTGSLDIDYVRVRKPDGSVIDTPPENIQDMPSEITRSAPFYSDLHEKHIAVKGLSVGDVLEYKWTAHVTKPLIPGQFWTFLTFPHDYITLENQVEISVPRERAVKFKSVDPQPVISENGSYRVYTWSLAVLSRPVKDEKVEAVKTAWQQARGRLPLPDAQLTSFSSWEELGRWYRDLQADRVKPTPEITAKATELTKGLADDDAKLRAIYHYVSTQFRYIGVAFGVGRYQPHFAAEVLNNQYGDCKDKHTLLASLLLASGIQAYPALIHGEHDIDPDIPSPAQFNHVITVIPRGDSLLWLDATAEVAPFQFLLSPLRDKHALLVFNDKPATLVTTPVEVPYPFSQNFQMDASLDEQGTLTGNAQLLTRGDIEFFLRSAFRATPMPQWKDVAQNIAKLLGFAGDVSDVTISSPEKTDEPFRLSYKYTRKEFADWDNHRIVAPSAFIALPPVSPELNSFPIRVYLGQPIDILVHSQLQLPKTYTLEVPDAVHLKRDFAQFDASYSFRDGKLISDRHIQTFKLELTNSDFPDYEKFWDTVQNDYGQFIQLVSGDPGNTPKLLASLAPPISPGSVPSSSAPSNEVAAASLIGMGLYGADFPDSSNQDALHLESQAQDALRNKDPQTAISSLYRAVAADPKFVRAWLILAQVLLLQNQTDAATDALQKAVAVNPQDPQPLRIYAMYLANLHKFDEAVPVWQAYMKLDPDDVSGPASLAVALSNLHRYDEAAQALESAVKLNPNSTIYRQLGAAYLNAGKIQKSEAAYRKFLELTPQPRVISYAGYEMALAKTTPPLALEMAQQAVKSFEQTSNDMDLADDRDIPANEDLTLSLAYSWATLGFVHQRLGHPEDAEKFLLAAWKLSQSGVAAAHLCELYVDQHKTQSALHMCRLARSRLPLEKDPFGYHVPELIVQNDARLEKLSPGSSKTYDSRIVDDILAMRDFKLPAVVQGVASAEFLVLLQYDPQLGAFKVTGTKFDSGSPKLKSAGKSLTKLNFNFASPDHNEVTLVRRGTFLCGVGCEFILPDPTNSKRGTVRLTY
jgi:tetratricopeptide (TPR) repeat protein